MVMIEKNLIFTLQYVISRGMNLLLIILLEEHWKFLKYAYIFTQNERAPPMKL